MALSPSFSAPCNNKSGQDWEEVDGWVHAGPIRNGQMGRVMNVIVPIYVNGHCDNTSTGNNCTTSSENKSSTLYDLWLDWGEFIFLSSGTTPVLVINSGPCDDDPGEQD